MGRKLAGTARWGWVLGLAASAATLVMPGSTESAIANGDTRTISLYHAHTHESITATFMVDGQYDQAVLDKLNWFLRDWRRDEPTKMSPQLFDVIWSVYRESGSQQPIMVMSAYRSPETNAMLRRRTRGVAEHSQHILGHAMDQHYMDVPMSKIRDLGMKLQRGGVGFYPTAGTPFVHLDVGGVRHWPRMSYDQLARLFPDGKTVHIPSNGVPLPGYEMARAELESRGDTSYPTATQLKSKGFFAWLFGGGGSDEDDDDAQAGIRRRPQPQGAGTRMASADPSVQPGSYGKSSADRGGGFNLFSDPPRTLFSPQTSAAQTPAAQPPVAPAAAPPRVAAPEPAPLPAMADAPPAPAATPIPQQAVALALPPAAPGPVAVSGDGMIPRDLPVPPSFAAAALPMPPRRPAELASAEPAAPLPPTRPTGLSAQPHDVARGAAPSTGRPDAIASLLGPGGGRAGRLPDVITQGVGGQRPPGLGYAAVASLPGGDRDAAPDAVPMPVARPAALQSTKLDRSNFRTLTRPDPVVRSSGRSALGAAIPALRAGGSRADLSAPGGAGSHTSFQARASDLSVDRFSGTVTKPTARANGSLKTTMD